jgi:hypothetical protein
MKKTTIYLPDDLKEQVEIQAKHCGRSEAQFIRDAVSACVGVPPSEPKIPLTGKGLGKNISLNIDEHLDGFGE